MDERVAALIVATARGVGPATAAKLLALFGSYSAVVLASMGKGPGRHRVPQRAGGAIAGSVRAGFHRDQLARMRRSGARFAIAGDPDFPRILSEIARPPVGLFVVGDTVASLPPMVAVVGSRAATPRGRAVARALALGLVGEGIGVASGLARGIDTEAHRGAIEGGGRTVAVLGSSVDRIYPPENAGLVSEIGQSGAVLSEFAMGQPAMPGSFPRRNRIISGLCLGVVVVEAGERSGALITAAHALEQGREVFAVPGPIDEPLSRGPNQLIKAGAKLVESVQDILEELCGPLGAGVPPRRTTLRPERLRAAAGAIRGCRGQPGLLWARQGAGEGVPAGGPEAAGERGPAGGLQASEAPVRERILARLSLTPVSVDELARSTGARVGEVLSALMELELAGLARACPGGRFVGVASG